jgi:hypothetical protein
VRQLSQYEVAVFLFTNGLCVIKSPQRIKTTQPIVNGRPDYSKNKKIIICIARVINKVVVLNFIVKKSP